MYAHLEDDDAATFREAAGKCGTDFCCIQMRFYVTNDCAIRLLYYVARNGPRKRAGLNLFLGLILGETLELKLQSLLDRLPTNTFTFLSHW
jgi:hypothetical protein